MRIKHDKNKNYKKCSGVIVVRDGKTICRDCAFGLLLDKTKGKKKKKSRIDVLPLRRYEGSTKVKLEEYYEYINAVETPKVPPEKWDALSIEGESSLFNEMMKKVVISRKSSQWMGFTLTFKPFWFNRRGPRTLHLEAERHITTSLPWQGKSFVMFPEFNKAGILHYHGFVHDCYEVEFLKMMRSWQRKYGHVDKFLEASNKDIWIKYLLKDRHRNGLWYFNHL